MEVISPSLMPIGDGFLFEGKADTPVCPRAIKTVILRKRPACRRFIGRPADEGSTAASDFMLGCRSLTAP